MEPLVINERLSIPAQRFITGPDQQGRRRDETGSHADRSRSVGGQPDERGHPVGPQRRIRPLRDDDPPRASITQEPVDEGRQHLGVAVLDSVLNACRRNIIVSTRMKESGGSCAWAQASGDERFLRCHMALTKPLMTTPANGQ